MCHFSPEATRLLSSLLLVSEDEVKYREVDESSEEEEEEDQEEKDEGEDEEEDIQDKSSVANLSGLEQKISLKEYKTKSQTEILGSGQIPLSQTGPTRPASSHDLTLDTTQEAIPPILQI